MTTKQTKEKVWLLKNNETAEGRRKINEISQALDIHPIIAKLLFNRGYTDVRSVSNFIRMENEMLCNPFLLKDIEKGIKRIKKAIDSQEKITVYGDYDVDGVTSVCTLYLYLKSKGAIIDYYIPNRTGEGYGVSINAIDQIKSRGTSLIITVDTGTTAIEEVEYGKSKGIDFVITDHHECPIDVPNAVAVINPHRPDCEYPFKELAGVGVVFKLISAYEEMVYGKSKIKAATELFTSYADLVAIGTIADVMPIKDENRIIVSYGLKMLEKTARPGIIALIEATARPDSQRSEHHKKRTKITSSYIGYSFAPRINAAGRIRSAEIAVELFLADNEEDARRIADELCKANKERQNEENNIIKEAYEKIKCMNLDENPVIVLDADSWHHGVIGIVASRITEKYSHPSILVSFEGNNTECPSPNDIGKGSGRSIKGLNLVDALYHCSDILVKFGGHELAAGLSVTRENLNVFRDKINEYAKNNLCDSDMTPTLDADCEITFEDITLSLAQELQNLEPFGVGNPVPNFVIKNTTVVEVSPVSEGKHTKIILGNGKSIITAMYFSTSADSLNLYVGEKIDVLFNIDINEWLGRKSVQLIVRDIKHSEAKENITEKHRKRFEQIWQGDSFSENENILPTRQDFVAVYTLVTNSFRVGNNTLTHREIIHKLSKNEHCSIGYVKLKIIIKVFIELNLLGIEEIKPEVYKFTVKYTQKTNLDKSNLLRRLKNQQRK